MLANFSTEQALYQDLIGSSGELKILMFQGRSGAGKSYLIDHCLQLDPEQPYSLLKLQNGGDTISALFHQMGFEVGWKHLPTFTSVVAALLKEVEEPHDPLWWAQMHRHLERISSISDPKTLYRRFQHLSDAWFADVFSFEKPRLLVIDTYEKATTDFDLWFSREFLPGVARSTKMRALIGGRRVPERHSDRVSAYETRELKEVTRVDDWLTWANQQGYAVPSVLELQSLIADLEGRPSDIANSIKGQYSKTSVPADRKAQRAEARATLRENLRKAFNLSELYDICFDMGINYEEVPEHDVLGGFARELLRLVERFGRSRELIGICKRRRPNLEWQIA